MTPRSILHVDMDAFYVSVELLRRPELRGRPVVVGGSSERGVVAAASYEARVHGIRSAMPAVRARRLCPEAVFLPGDHAHYSEVSGRVMALFRSFTPLVEPISLDEAFLDVSGALRSGGTAPDIAHAIRRLVGEREGLPCSVGCASNKFVAKLASEAAKPRPAPTGPVPGRGVVVVEPDQVLDFLWPLPVTALWGVGPATERRLARMGVLTVADLARQPVERLCDHLGTAQGRHLHALAHGIDDRPVVADHEARSVSHEETFAHDLFDRDRLVTEVVRLADGVASRLRRAGSTGRTVTLKVRYGDFRTISRSRTLPVATASAREIARTARQLLEGVDTADGVRLLGVGVSALDDRRGQQLVLDLVDGAGASHGKATGAPPEAWHRAEDAVETIRDRFGPDAIGSGRLLDGSGLRVKRRGDQPWGPGADGVPAGPG